MSAKILIVEDEVLLAADLEATLQDHGHIPVGVAADTDMAIELAKHAPDLAFVDINLRDGRTGVSIGHMLADSFGVSVIFLTANPRLVTSRPAGAVGILSKPCTDSMIAPVVDYAMGIRNGVALARPIGLQAFS